MARHVHLPNFATLDGCELVALAERRDGLLEAVADRYRIPRRYPDHHALAADPEVDAVGVSGAWNMQGEIAADLLRAGKHVFVEKPMAASVEQAERILAAADEGRARLMVAYMKRYDPGNELARQTVVEWRASGHFGRVVFARAHGFGGNWLAGLDASADVASPGPPDDVTFDHAPAWLEADLRQAYAWFVKQYCHNVNLLRFLLGVADDASVRLVDLDDDGRHGIVVLELGGVRAVIESGSLDYHAWDEHTQVYFERGWIRVAPAPLFSRPGVSKVEIYEGGSSPELRMPIAPPLDVWHYRAEAASFIRALETGEPFLSSGEDTLTDVRLGEETFRVFRKARSEGSPASNLATISGRTST